MEPQHIRKFIVPAIAVAAVIVVVALLLGVGGSPGGSAAKAAKHTGSITVPDGVDASDAGMSSTPPPVESPNWIVQPGGLKIWDVKEGTGEPVAKGQKVLAQYAGWLASDGKEFDSTRSHGGQALEFGLLSGNGGVIKGWVDGIPGMKVGGIRRLYIPWPLAYGAAGRPPSIPANADLIFEVKLIGFQ